MIEGWFANTCVYCYLLYISVASHMASKRVNKKILHDIVQEVKKRPCLWNTEDEYYNNRGRVAVAWEEITAILNLPEALIRAKWKNMRDVFKREIKRCKYNAQGEYEYTGKWGHLRRLWFLHKPRAQTQDEQMEREHSDSAETEIKEEVPILVNASKDIDVTDDNIAFDGSNIFSMDYQHEQDPLPLNRRSSEDDYDLMFLKSLVPYLGKWIQLGS